MHLLDRHLCASSHYIRLLAVSPHLVMLVTVVPVILAVVHQDVLEMSLNITEDLIHWTHGIHRSDFVSPLLYYRFGLVLECGQALLDGLCIIINTSRGLGPTHQSFGHLLVATFKIHDAHALRKLHLKLQLINRLDISSLLHSKYMMHTHFASSISNFNPSIV